MKTVAHTFTQLLSVACVLALALTLNYVSAWTAPSANPPAGNVAAPLNTSATAQVKDGNISVGRSTNTASDFGLISYGKVRSTVGGFQFPDGTVQTTAAGGGGSLIAIRSYTANATWSKPAGLSYVVVKVWGGGGAGENYAGASGASGGTSSFGAFLSASGGIRAVGGPGAGGTGSGGNINLTGQDGEYVRARDGAIGAAGGAGGTAAGGGGGGGFGGWANGASAGDGKIPGGGGGGAGDHHASNAPAGGGGGGYAEEMIPAASLGATEAVTVGAGGLAVVGSPAGGDGAAGMVIVYEYQ